MSGTAQPMPFSMPMFRSFVPERIRPWMYVFIAFTFQFSGGLYLGTLNQMMGEFTRTWQGWPSISLYCSA